MPSLTWIKTRFPGVRYREHPTRKYGSRPDRYFTIRFKLDGRDKEEALGWTSEGWTEAKAVARRSELKENQRLGTGPRTLAEKRALGEKRRQAEQQAREQETLEKITVSEIWEQRYYPHAQESKKKRSFKTEDGLFRLWIEPVIGYLSLNKVAPIHIEKIKMTLSKAGRSVRSVQYAMAVIRQLYNYARNNDLYRGDNPIDKVKKPTSDNRRVRFLTHAEADVLLEKLKAKSIDLHDMALLSLHCGLRAGEIFKLSWADIDSQQGLVCLRDTKSNRTRFAHMTAAVRVMFEARPHADLNAKVYPARHGERDQISKMFNTVVGEVGLNEGITDPRQKVVFHTLRHTFASWLVQQGTPLYTVAKLMGHRTISMTERYSHLAPDHLQEAVRQLELSLEASATARKKKKEEAANEQK